MVQRIKLGELLVRAGVITESRLKAALAEQKRWGGRLGKILVDMNFVSEEIMVKALSKQLALPLAKLDSATPIPRDVLLKIDPDFAQLNSLCPERYIGERRVLVVAMADPINVHAIDELARMTGLRIEATIGGERAISQAIAKTFGRSYSEISPENFTDSTGAQIRREDPDIQRSRLPTPEPANDLFPNAPPPPAPPSLPPIPPAPIEGYPSYPPPASMRPSPSSVELARTLEEAQRKQLRALRAMVELMIEKGVFSREEFTARVSRR